MNWRKVLAGAAAVTMVTAFLGGCAGTSGEKESGAAEDNSAVENSGTAGADAAEGISGSITIWEHAFSFEESTRQIVEGFMEQYPEIEVEYEIKDGSEYYSLLSTAIQAGDGPDLFWTNGTATTNMADYVANGICQELSDEVNFELFDDAALNLATVGDGLYSIPWLTMDTRAVFYNKDMFEENGWMIPETFGEFETLLAEIKESGVTPVSLCGVDTYTLLFAYEPLLSAMAPEYVAGLADYSVKATDAPAADALNKMLDWADKGYFGNNWLGVSDNNAQILAFTSGETAMNIAGSWDAATISENNPELNFGAFQIPSETGETGLVGTPANGFSVNSASQNLDAALCFANYCASLEAQTIWVQSQGAVSASTEIEPSTEIAKDISASGNGNIYTSWQSVLANYSETGEAITIWDEDFPKIFSGDVAVDDFMNDISETMQ